MTNQQALIAGFLSQTTLANEQTAREYLSFYDWDLEPALKNYFIDSRAD